MHRSQWNRFLNTLELRLNRIALRSRPWMVQLETTSRCNIRCIQCYREKMFGAGENLDLEVLDRVDRELLPYARELLASFYGEPLLYPHIEKVFEIVKRHPHLRAGFFTNALLLNERRIEQVLEAGFSYLNISIDGATRETYEAIRQGANFDLLRRNLEALKRKRREWETRGGKHLALNMRIVGMRQNVEEIPLFVEMAREFEFDCVDYYVNMNAGSTEEIEKSALNHFPELTNRMFEAGDDLCRKYGIKSCFNHVPFPAYLQDHRPATKSPTDSFTRKIRDAFSRAYAQSGNSIFLMPLLLLIKVILRIPIVSQRYVSLQPDPNEFGADHCGNPWSYVNIKTNGIILACCFSQAPLGSIKDKSFDEVWNGPAFLDLRESLAKQRPWRSCLQANCNYLRGLDSEKYRYEWMDAPREIDLKAQPDSQSAPLLIDIAVRNLGSLAWLPPTQDPEHFVTLAWYLYDKDRRVLQEGGHVPVSDAIVSGSSTVFAMPVPNNIPPGEYCLIVDMVHEGITWFKERGQQPHEINLRIR
jgi:MoaA/NifB/PqqE/SkfB family radical SAM enzyme